MPGVILHIDNEIKDLETWGKLLEQSGYQVLPAKDIETASRILEQRRVHLALIDIRLKIQDSGQDISGIVYARNEIFKEIPKLFLTAYKQFDYAVKTLSPDSDGVPYSLGLVIKGEGPDPLLNKLEMAFEEHVKINWDLDIRWNGYSPLGILGRMNPKANLAWVKDRSLELEDLIRKLFCSKISIVIVGFLWIREARCAVEVVDTSKKIHQRYIVICKDREATGNDDHMLSIPGYRAEEHATTQRFSATAWQIVTNELEEEIKTLAQIIPWQSSTVNVKFIDTMFQNVLQATLNANEMRRAQEYVDYLLGEESQFKRSSPLTAEFKNNIETIITEAEDRQAISKKVFARSLLSIEKLSSNTFPLMLTPEEIPFCISIAEMDPGTICVNRNIIWPSDPSHNVIAPVWHMFVSLEVFIRRNQVIYNSIRNILDLEATLLKIDTLKGAIHPNEVERQYRSFAQIIQAIRHNAATLLGPDLLPYLNCLFLIMSSQILEYYPNRKYTNQEIKMIVYLLNVAGLVKDKLFELYKGGSHHTQLHTSYPPLVINTRNDVCLGSQAIQLTDREFAFLSYLYEHAGDVCDRIDILKHAFGIDDPGSADKNGLINANLRRIWEKLEPDPGKQTYLITVRGQGIKLILAPSDP